MRNGKTKNGAVIDIDVERLQKWLSQNKLQYQLQENPTCRAHDNKQ